MLYNKTFKRFEPEEEEMASDSEWSIAVEETGQIPETEKKEELSETEG